jgi:hypothetical protein
MMDKRALLFAIAVAGLQTVAAIAQTPAGPGPAAPAAVQPGAAAAAPPAAPAPASRWTADQIRQAFDLADSDTNGELSRSEAQRLTILPRSFEDMDQNKDGVLSRVEYQAGFAR